MSVCVWPCSEVDNNLRISVHDKLTSRSILAWWNKVTQFTPIWETQPLIRDNANNVTSSGKKYLAALYRDRSH